MYMYTWDTTKCPYYSSVLISGVSYKSGSTVAFRGIKVGSNFSNESQRHMRIKRIFYCRSYPQLLEVCSEMESSLRPETVISRGKPYLDELAPKKKQMGEFFEVVVKEGGSLADFFQKPPIDSTDPEKGSRIDNQLSTLEVHKSHIEELWQNAWQLAEQGKQV